jgi:hypothetical protein
MIALLFSLMFTHPQYAALVAVEEAYVIATYKPTQKCCGLCKNGKITHGDGHVTDCVCPRDCLCRTKSVLKDCKTCLPSK